ncbi:FAD binding domain-containing protein [Nocardioides sp. ChNu-153]|uniref:FAD binding domain-containing protein n=1 Tax=unclassified Nocardioides TaxID=2615069 RepID=UPI002404A9B1|nr:MULTISPECIES: FAD binding domain-containing protein [unclassified Nocardioides]MDF9718107.1 FAD binding domain-containing protein [Nocardioides sp. ChNu-99]MDN7120191.1 FAD binding domain-containing protein [Nocardioides sp. ChNu-153]
MDLAELTGVRVARTTDDLVLRPGEAWLGGGSWLYSTPQPHLTGLVDLTGMGWAPTARDDDGALRIAGTCTVAELVAAAATWPAADPATASAAALVRRCADAFLMSSKVWSVATVGGNLCLGLPAGAMITLTAALDGVADLWSPDRGARAVPVVDLVTGPGRTDRAGDELLRGVDVPAAALTARYASRQLALTPVGRSSALVVGRLDADGACTLVVTAATTRPLRLRFPALPGAAEVTDALAGVTTWYDDPHGPADWRAGITPVLAAEVLAELAVTTSSEEVAA